MLYYINVTSWNLLETFVTESLSPYSFYRDRSFGNSLSRYLDATNERGNYLILSTKDRGGDYVIKVDDSLLDPSCIELIKGSKTLFTYNKTIFYKKGKVFFRFASEDLKDSLIAESQILFEVKCVDKYASDFYVNAVKQEKVAAIKTDNPFSFQQQEFISQDDSFNKVKGAIVAYTRGIASSVNGDMSSLIMQVKNLKNSFAGLNTAIMINDSSVNNAEVFIKSIKVCKDVYLKTTSQKTNLFDILEQQFYEIVKLASMRANEILEYYHADKVLQEEDLLKEKDKLEKKLLEIERATNISNLREELEDIKAEEKRNGERCNKSRIYFKKGTEKYERKQFLKSEIKKFEKSNNEYRCIKLQISKIEQKICGLTNAPTTFDAAIGAIFVRISDITNELLRNLNTNMNSVSSSDIDFSILKKEDSPYIYLDDSTYSQAEIDFFNVALKNVLYSEYKNVAETYILDLIIESANEFKTLPSAKTNEGQSIIRALRMYWNYKHNKAIAFDIPINLPLFCSMMAFFVKPLGFDQMERYMQNKGIENKQYAFMLWGAYIGYAALPKTFTNMLYAESQTYKRMDDYIFTVHKNIELQRPCNQ